MKRKPKRVWHVYRESGDGWYGLSELGKAGGYALLSPSDWRVMGMKALRPGQRAKVTVTIEGVEVVKCPN